MSRTSSAGACRLGEGTQVMKTLLATAAMQASQQETLSSNRHPSSRYQANRLRAPVEIKTVDLLVTFTKIGRRQGSRLSNSCSNLLLRSKQQRKRPQKRCVDDISKEKRGFVSPRHRY